MEIKYLGQSSFLIETKTAKIVIDPFEEKSTGFPFPKIQADLVLVTHQHHDHNNVAAVGGTPFLISGPGEYEVKNVKVDGLPSYHDNQEGKERGRNTVYQIRAEGLSLLHCGDLGHQLSEGQLEHLGDIHILFVPVGGTYTLGLEDVTKLVGEVEPKIVIPMHYKLPKSGKETADLLPVDNFVKEMGGEPHYEKVLKIKRETLPEDMIIVVL